MRPVEAVDLIVVGDVMVDVGVDAGLLATGGDVRGEVRLRPGGAGANAAVWAAASGARVRLFGRVGDDLAGRLVTEELRARGVDPCLAVDPAVSTGAMLVVRQPSDRSMVADRGANTRLVPEDLPASLTAGAVLVSGYLLLDASSEAAARAALERVDAPFVAVEAASWPLVQAFGRDRFLEATSGATLLLANEREAEALTGIADGRRAAFELAERYGAACVKLGPAGAVFVTGERAMDAHARPVRTVDPTGAGDAFGGTLLAFLAAGRDPRVALEAACAAGARTVGAFGPWPGPAPVRSMRAAMSPHERLRLSEPVAAALKASRPVVALETSVLVQGLPHPRNLEVAVRMSAAIRDRGAEPAWIAVDRGAITVGIPDDELRRLAFERTAAKVARRDLPVALAGGGAGATTVSATLWAARRAGIEVMATGGIGGVHPGTGDVSADLFELARTPGTVVCSGPKSIVDPAATHERLEELGVAVVGYGTDRLPFFLATDAGIALEHRADSPDQVAAIAAARRSMGVETALLICNPIAPDAAMDRAVVAEAVQRCERRLYDEHVTGKAVTPFLLSCLAEATGGASLEANIALLIANAALAADIAVAFAAGNTGNAGRAG